MKLKLRIYVLSLLLILFLSAFIFNMVILWILGITSIILFFVILVTIVVEDPNISVQQFLYGEI